MQWFEEKNAEGIRLELKSKVLRFDREFCVSYAPFRKLFIDCQWDKKLDKQFENQAIIVSCLDKLEKMNFNDEKIL